LLYEVGFGECNKRRAVAVDDESAGAAVARPTPSTRTAAKTVANMVNFILTYIAINQLPQ
jgi:hypothetical protein